MPHYMALPIQEDVKAIECSLEAFRWRKGRLLSADLYFGSERFLRVSFSGVVIFRLSDDVEIAEEDQNGHFGIVKQHILYAVEDAHFWNSNRALIDQSEETLHHYRVITGDHCMDVIAAAEPRTNILSVVKS
jgi:hypothetical protein